MSSLSEFLLSRIAEDAQRAAAAADRVTPRWDEKYNPADGLGDYRDVGDGAGRPVVEASASAPTQQEAEHIATWDPARVLAECEAKRRIVERCHAAIENDPRDPDDPEWVAEVIDSLTWSHLYDLAAIYADHPDYDEAWRP